MNKKKKKNFHFFGRRMRKRINQLMTKLIAMVFVELQLAMRGLLIIKKHFNFALRYGQRRLKSRVKEFSKKKIVMINLQLSAWVCAKLFQKYLTKHQ